MGVRWRDMSLAENSSPSKVVESGGDRSRVARAVVMAARVDTCGTGAGLGAGARNGTGTGTRTGLELGMNSGRK